MAARRRKKAKKKATKRRGAKRKKKATKRKATKRRKKATKRKATKRRKKATKRKKKKATKRRKKTTKRKKKKATKRKAKRKVTKKKARKKTKKKAAKKKAKRKVKRKPNPAFMKPLQPDAMLGAVVGTQPLPRTEVTKKLWAYIRRHGLQDSTNRRMINADAALRAVFGGKSQVSMFEMTKLVARHLR